MVVVAILEGFGRLGEQQTERWKQPGVSCRPFVRFASATTSSRSGLVGLAGRTVGGMQAMATAGTGSLGSWSRCYTYDIDHVDPEDAGKIQLVGRASGEPLGRDSVAVENAPLCDESKQHHGTLSALRQLDDGRLASDASKLCCKRHGSWLPPWLKLKQPSPSAT
ncbi:hypothetical protein S40293_11038 [Stachybotrys chartarum IBT 40293]|nr:hypothetical protein S40293_11038 [Stachybotrys chartarum IBT 40293]